MFTHLHVHDCYSLADSISKPEDIVNKIKELGYKAFAITNHGNLYSLVKLQRISDAAGMKLILGVEFYITDDTSIRDNNNRYQHLVVLAYNETGRINLNKLVSLSNKSEHFYYKPRIDKTMLLAHKDGLIILSACMAGEVQRYIMGGDITKARSAIQWYKNNFGENYYVELQSHNTPEQHQINKTAYVLAKECGVECVITTDSHYTNKEDIKVHSMWIQIAQDREVGETYIDCYLQSESDIYEINSDTFTKDEIAEFINNTNIVADKCNTRVPLSAPRLNSTTAHHNTLIELCKSGWHKRNIHNKPNTDEYRQRIRYELDAVKRMNFSNYFLLVHSYTSKAVKMGPGRGSAGGCLIAYLLGITNIDPVRFGLLFERFIDVHAVTLLESGEIDSKKLKVPDVDTDFSVKERYEIVQNLQRQYGLDKVYNIGIFNMVHTKSAIKNIFTILDIPYTTANEITKQLDDNCTIDDILNDKKFNSYIEKYNESFKYAKLILGLPRSFGSHASAKIISEHESNYYHAASIINGEMVIQCDMHDAEELGLIKLDLLGLRTLDVIYDTLDAVGKDYSFINVDTMDFNDIDVFKVFEHGETCGIFQFSSYGMRQTLREMKPNSLADLAAANALYRPGAIRYIDDYIKVKHGKTDVKYLHPDLAPILAETYGVLVYQEQLISIGRLAGMANADLLRKATGKKDAELMAKVEPEVKSGLMAKGWTDTQVDKLWLDMVEFANYSFNKSHAYAYAIIAYMTAYLKHYHPKEFTCALLNSYQGDIDKIGEVLASTDISWAPFSYIDCRSKCVVEGDKVYYGVSLIKDCNDMTASELYKLDAYPTFVDLLRHTKINKKALEKLIALNFFGYYGKNKKLLAIYEAFKRLYKDSYVDKTKAKRLDELYKLEAEILDESYAYRTQIELDTKYVGHPMSTYDIDKYITVVLDLDTKYSPKVKLYSLGSGRINTVKIPKKLYETKTLARWDIVRIVKWDTRERVVKVDDKFETVKDTVEFWLKDYEVIECII